MFGFFAGMKPRLSTNFDEYAVGSNPTGWTQRSGSHDWKIEVGETGKRVKAALQGNDVVSLTWDLIVLSDANFDLLGRLVSSATFVDATHMMGFTQVIDNGQEGLGFGFRKYQTSIRAELSYYHDGGHHDGDITSLDDNAQLERYYFRATGRDGNDARLKVWRAGDPEPASYQMTHIPVPPATRVGLFAVGCPAFYVDWFSFVPSSTKHAPFPQG